MQYKMGEIIEVDGKKFLEDYRIKNGRAEFIKGNLRDLKSVYFTSVGLGDLLGCCASIDMDMDNFVVLQYGNKFALGVK